MPLAPLAPLAPHPQGTKPGHVSARVLQSRLFPLRSAVYASWNDVQQGRQLALPCRTWHSLVESMKIVEEGEEEKKDKEK
jgi:hypothetical protein